MNLIPQAWRLPRARKRGQTPGEKHSAVLPSSPLQITQRCGRMDGEREKVGEREGKGGMKRRLLDCTSPTLFFFFYGCRSTMKLFQNFYHSSSPSKNSLSFYLSFLLSFCLFLSVFLSFPSVFIQTSALPPWVTLESSFLTLGTLSLASSCHSRRKPLPSQGPHHLTYFTNGVCVCV